MQNLLLPTVMKIKALPLMKISISSVLDVVCVFFLPLSTNRTEKYSASSWQNHELQAIVFCDTPYQREGKKLHSQES